MPMVRSAAEFLAEEQYRTVLSGLPIVEVVRIGDSKCEPLSQVASSPPDGSTRSGHGTRHCWCRGWTCLALHGAAVFSVWRPDKLKHDSINIAANVGVRSTMLCPGRSEGGGDVFSACSDRRTSFLLTKVCRWKGRRRFVPASSMRPSLSTARRVLGQTASVSTRLPELLLDDASRRRRIETGLNDHIVARLLATAVMAALMRQAVEGGSL